MNWGRFCVVFLCVFLMHTPVFAHAPYFIKQRILTTDEGQKFIVEKACGDGIFFADPMRLQVRAMNGAVVARSPVYEHAAVLCFSLQQCWVFPYGSFNLFASGWKLDPSQMKLNMPPPEYVLNGEAARDFADYLSNADTRRVAGFGFGYPEHMPDERAFSVYTATLLLSPIFILANIWLAFLTVALSVFGLGFLYRACLTPPSGGMHIFVIVLNTIGGLGAVCLSLVFIGYVFLLCFTYSFPIFYMLLAMMGGYMGFRLRIKSNSKEYNK